MTCRQLDELLTVQGAAWPTAAADGLENRIEREVLGSLKPVSPVPSTAVFVLGFLGVFLVIVLLGAAIMGARAPRLMSWWQFAGLGLMLLAAAAVLAVSLGRQLVPGSCQRVCPKTLVFSTAAGLPLLWSMLFPWKSHGDYLRWGLACGLLGVLLAGLAGVGMMHLGCPNVTAPHLSVWHGAVPVACTLAGCAWGNLFTYRKRLS